MSLFSSTYLSELVFLIHVRHVSMFTPREASLAEIRSGGVT